MKPKVALLLMLVFASTVTATAMAFSIPTPVAFDTLGSKVAVGNSIVEPLGGDPIDDPTPPHFPY